MSLDRTRNNAPRIKHPPIIARFVSRYKGNQVYISPFKSKESYNFEVENLERLYVNEILTQKQKQLFRHTKQKAKDINYKFYWTFNRQIIVRKNEERDKTYIKHERNLNLF